MDAEREHIARKGENGMTKVHLFTSSRDVQMGFDTYRGSFDTIELAQEAAKLHDDELGEIVVPNADGSLRVELEGHARTNWVGINAMVKLGVMSGRVNLPYNWLKATTRIFGPPTSV